MKHMTVISDEALRLVWGGSGMIEKPAHDNPYGFDELDNHGKTQPGNNEDIFSRDR